MQALEHCNGRTLTGIVVSDKNDKTIVVRVETLVKHPLLKKYIRRRFASFPNALSPVRRYRSAKVCIRS